MKNFTHLASNPDPYFYLNTSYANGIHGQLSYVGGISFDFYLFVLNYNG